MLTGKPIIDAFDTQHSPLRYSNVSLVVEAENIESIANAIKKASLLSNDELNEIKNKSINYVILNHNYEKLANDFAKEFKK
ncbi:hypothetical protein SAMN02745883_01337 [Caminicella sporogenes DSM 14501]|uniref:Uncharacterized protein n=1 Tax=Caminicella sporogenes DSM 14501 TaxID=1121266 RepID=A0A1M6PW63_9FIRM|nr:hypothetical protein [Caminicella sporogenes]RKD21946.1 hypothetical protein BET04_06760 [Caminicella sporogenes]SHK12126.1 hypothetical protein SAMN02745883_01337 [Caminicella sporogenes DSM 14501]